MATCSGRAVQPPRTPDPEGLSDDSGVDLRSQLGESTTKLNSNTVSSFLVQTPDSGGSRKNKRKSSEPRRRREVLQMKRFRWESDEEASDSEEIGPKDNESDRPSSGDSGFLAATGRPLQEPSPPATWEKPAAAFLAPPHHLSVIRRVDTPPTSETKLIGQPKIASVSPVRTTCHSSPAFSARPVTRRTSQESLDGQEDSLHSECQDVHSATNRTSSSRTFKTMDRKRRIEANARERTRVHTISAAFESLRRAVPAYADSQKLSKLAILRIACQYILALACLNDLDYSREQRKPTFAECVDMCTRTIQAEGRARRRIKE